MLQQLKHDIKPNELVEKNIDLLLIKTRPPVKHMVGFDGVRKKEKEGKLDG